MNPKTIRHAVALAGLVMVTVWPGFNLSLGAPAVDASAAKPDAELLAPVLQSKDASAAWQELQTATQPPDGPKEWRDTPPTPQEREKYYMPFVKALVGKAKDFYTRFPQDTNAVSARLMEFRFLYITVSWGDTSQQEHLDALEKSLLNDGKIPDEARVSLLHSVAQAAKPEKILPLLQDLAGHSSSAALKTAAAGELDKLKALGQPVNLQFTAVDGRSVDLAKLKGKVVLVDFWATWCGPCVGEVPNVKKTYDQFHSKGFEIVGISLDKEKDKLTAFTADHKMEWPQYFDGMFWQNKYARQFGIESIPTMWLIDKKGNLRDMNAREDLSGGVEKLLAE